MCDIRKNGQIYAIKQSNALLKLLFYVKRIYKICFARNKMTTLGNKNQYVMLGAVIGDIAGSVYEFDNTKDYDFEMFPSGSMWQKKFRVLWEDMVEVSGHGFFIRRDL